MDRVEFVTLREMAQCEGIPEKTLQKRLERKSIISMPDPEDGRRRLYPISAMSPGRREMWLKGQADAALAGQQNPEQAIALASGPALEQRQPVLPFAPPSPSQAARDAVVAAIPKAQRIYVDPWLQEFSQSFNGTWKMYLGKSYNGRMISSYKDFMLARCGLLDVSPATYYARLRSARQILHDPTVPKATVWAKIAESLLPKPRPGRRSFFADPRPEVAWQFPALREFKLNQAQFSDKDAHNLLLKLIDKKQRAWGMEHYYPRPTLAQCRTALKKISKPELVLGREGEKAFDDQCGKYISRDPNSLRANTLWVTDQREVDVRMRDGGEHLGRMWMVSFLDVASDKVLGYAFGPILSSEIVMLAATMAIERYGVPRAVHMDLGKEFICKAFNGSTRKFSGEVLYREAQGLWNSLGVKIVKAIGRNPKSKTIERFHREVTRQFDKRFPGYCGSDVDTRPEKLATEERQHLDWLAGEREHTPLVSIGQYIRAFIQWAEHDWNGAARGRGKMRCGMTPNECFITKRPAEGLRTITLDELDHHSAEHRFVKVARGGQVNLSFFGQTVEYEAPELFHLQGEDVEVIVSRRTFRQVTVIYPIAGGTASCVARLKPQLAWLPENRDELRAAMRCKAAVHRAVRQGLKASRVALEAANPVDLLEQQKQLPAREIVGSQKFFADTTAKPLGYAEIGSLEYQAERMGMRGRRRSMTSEEVANEALKSLQEETERKPRGLNFSDVVE
jgi:transposase InsO family protein